MRYTLLYLAVAAMLLAGCNGRKAETTKPPKTDTVPVMVMQIRKCAKLYTAEYKVYKIVTHDDEVRLKGTFLGQKLNMSLPFSDRKVAVPIDATLKAYIDFGGFSEQNVVRRGGKIEIILPDPKVELTSSRVNHEETKRQVSLFRADFTDKELTAYEQQGRAAILNSVPQTGIIEMAREGAAHVLVPMITQLGYREEDITVTFRKKFTTEDLPLILKDTSIENDRKQ